MAKQKKKKSGPATSTEVSKVGVRLPDIEHERKVLVEHYERCLLLDMEMDDSTISELAKLIDTLGETVKKHGK